MATRAVTALFDDYDAAARAVDKLEAEGIPHADISIVASDPENRLSERAAQPGRAAPAAESDAVDGAGTGATLGTVLGGGAGLLAGIGLLAIPGLGPVVAAGWLVAAVTGAGVGAATGGLIGGLTGAGLSPREAETYAEGVRRGGTLVTARVDADMADRVLAILDKHGSIDLDERAQGWRAQGWTGGTGEAGLTRTTDLAGPGLAGSGVDAATADGRPGGTLPPSHTPGSTTR